MSGAVACTEGCTVVLTPSLMVPLGEPLPAFALPDVEGRVVRSTDFAERSAFLVAFLCRHCAYTLHIKRSFARLAREYEARGVGVVGINANDDTYPVDAPEHMADDAKDAGYTFPYLFDETQAVARSFGAACTPDIFLYDRERRLSYRGQFDATRPGKGEAHGGDLRAALDAVLAGTKPNASQQPSAGCNIKWRPGNEPEHFRPGAMYPLVRRIVRVVQRLR